MTEHKCATVEEGLTYYLVQFGFFNVPGQTQTQDHNLHGPFDRLDISVVQWGPNLLPYMPLA